MQNFVNDIDPITLEKYKDIPSKNVIILTVGNKLRFYNVRSLYEWINIKPVDPTTKLEFSAIQIQKIKKIYKKSVTQHIYKCVEDFIKKNTLPKLPEFEIPTIQPIKMINILQQCDNIDMSSIDNIDQNDCKKIGGILGIEHSAVENIIDFAKIQINKNPELWENLFQTIIKNN